MPQPRPERDTDAAPATALALADVPVPIARPERDDDVAANEDASGDTTGDEAANDDTGDDRTADDSDAVSADRLAQAAPMPDLSGDDAPRIETPDERLNCVAYVRERTGFAIQGDAHLWWEHAYGLYTRAAAPSADAVMVFAATRKMRRGHVAVVARLVSDREIIVDHANWMRDGKLYLNVPVMDVSPDNDWSRVRVWNPRDNEWGARTYPIKGFVSARPSA
ncbi:MAG: CHAP domain-containing protein [Rhizomicrobium sp.]